MILEVVERLPVRVTISVLGFLRVLYGFSTGFWLVQWFDKDSRRFWGSFRFFFRVLVFFKRQFCLGTTLQLSFS